MKDFVKIALTATLVAGAAASSHQHRHRHMHAKKDGSPIEKREVGAPVVQCATAT